MSEVQAAPVQKEYGFSFGWAALSSAAGGAMGAMASGHPAVAAGCAVATGLLATGRSGMASAIFNTSASAIKTMEEAYDRISGKAIAAGIGTGAVFGAALAIRTMG